MSEICRFIDSEAEFRAPENCRFQVIPVPYEATVSYGGGTSQGPAAILQASCQLEAWTGRNIPLKQGIYTRQEVDCTGTAPEVLERIEKAVLTALDAGPQASLPSAEAGLRRGASSLPVLLGGEHTVTLGALRALKKHYGGFGIIQFDAHADLRSSYEGTPYSHACVMRRAVEELELPLFQVGVRSLSPEEALFRRERNIPCLDARAAQFPLAGRLCAACGGNGPEANLSGTDLRDLLPDNFPQLVFLTFDIDALDASLMPATGTPEPGGLFWWDALRLVEACLSGRVCLGFDVVELAPITGLHAPDFTAARLVYEIMGLIE